MNLRLFSLLFALPAFLIQGCASSSMTSKASGKTESGTSLPPSAYYSTRTGAKPSRESCPASDKSWRKESLRNLVRLAGHCVQLGQEARVEAMGDLLAQNHPNEPWGAYFLSLAAEMRKEYPRALWMIDLALKKSPRLAMLHYQKARVSWAMGDYRLAILSYKTAIQENPKFVDAHLFLAQVHYRDQDFKDAAKHFSAVVDIEPENVSALVGLAESKILLGDNRSAVSLYERVVSASPRNVLYRYKLASLYEDVKKDLPSALSAYKRLKAMLSTESTKSNDVPVNVDEKIRHLEGLVKQEDESEKKERQVSSSSDDKNKQKVKK